MWILAFIFFQSILNGKFHRLFFSFSFLIFFLLVLITYCTRQITGGQLSDLEREDGGHL